MIASFAYPVTMIVTFAYEMIKIAPDMSVMSHRLVSKLANMVTG